MARLWDAAGDKITGANPVSAAPITLSAWFYPETAGEGTHRSILQVGTAGSNNHRWTIQITNGNAARYIVRTTANANSDAGNAYTADAWNHMVGSSASATDHLIVLNGDWANRGTSSANRAPSGVDQFMIGNGFAGNVEFDGNIAEVAVWSAAHLTQGEIESLAAGAHPTKIRPASLVTYVSLAGTITDAVGALTLTDTNTADIQSHPPIFYPASAHVEMEFSTAAPAGGITAGTLGLAGVGI